MHNLKQRLQNINFYVWILSSFSTQFLKYVYQNFLQLTWIERIICVIMLETYTSRNLKDKTFDHPIAVLFILSAVPRRVVL